MYKYFKNKYKTFKLTRKLKKEKKYFDLTRFSFAEKNVLIVDEIIPEFNKDSGSRRLTEIIKLLLKNKVSVFLLADLKQYKYKSNYIRKFKDLGVNVYEPSLDNNKKLITKEDFIKQIASNIDIAWLHRPMVFNKYQSIIKAANSNIKLVFDMVDFHYIRLLREYEISKNETLKSEAGKFLNVELENCKIADVVVAISTTDKALLKKHFNAHEKVVLISNIHQHLNKLNGFNAFESRANLLFVGSFRHDPNKDAVKYLKNEIMPLVWEKLPDIEVNVIGSYITHEIQALKSKKFNLIGFVDDLNEALNTSRLFVAPLRFGAGIKGKIGQSLEYSLPLITSNIGAEGFEFGNQKNIMIANTATETAKKIIQLYTNKEIWESASLASQEILQPFSLANTEAQLLQIIND